MTNEEMTELKEDIYKGVDMVIEKAEAIGHKKTEWSIEELGMMSDIVKDAAEAHMYMTKAHYYSCEHSSEKF